MLIRQKSIWIMCAAGILLGGCFKEERKNPLLDEDNIQQIRNHIDIYTSLTDPTFDKECEHYLSGKQSLQGKQKIRCDEGVETMLKDFSKTAVGEPCTKADRHDPKVWQYVFGIHNEE